MMDGSFIETLVAELGRVSVSPVHEDANTKIVAIHNPGIATVIERIPKLPEPRIHKMQSLPGLLGWLNDDRVAPEAEAGMVFVGPDKVEAILGYRTTTKGGAVLALDESPDFKALRRIINGVNQKTLWELLFADLEGCIDQELALLISQITVRRNEEDGLQIAQSGSDGRASNSIRITFNGEDGASHTTAIRKDWKFTGRIFEAMDKPYEVELVLLIDPEKKPPIFRFHARRLDDVIRQARADLTKELRDGVKSEKWSVVEGSH